MSSQFRETLRALSQLTKAREAMNITIPIGGHACNTPGRAIATAGYATDSGFQVQHDQQNNKFFIDLGPDSEEAVLEYNESPNGVLDLYHTGVPVSHRGKKLGNLLAEAAFYYVLDQDLKMKLSCTFLQKYAKENPNEEFAKRIV